MATLALEQIAAQRSRRHIRQINAWKHEAHSSRSGDGGDPAAETSAATAHSAPLAPPSALPHSHGQSTSQLIERVASASPLSLASSPSPPAAAPSARLLPATPPHRLALGLAPSSPIPHRRQPARVQRRRSKGGVEIKARALDVLDGIPMSPSSDIPTAAGAIDMSSDRSASPSSCGSSSGRGDSSRSASSACCESFGGVTECSSGDSSSPSLVGGQPLDDEETSSPATAAVEHRLAVRRARSAAALRRDQIRRAKYAASTLSPPSAVISAASSASSTAAPSPLRSPLLPPLNQLSVHNINTQPSSLCPSLESSGSMTLAAVPVPSPHRSVSTLAMDSALGSLMELETATSGWPHGSLSQLQSQPQLYQSAGGNIPSASVWAQACEFRLEQLDACPFDLVPSSASLRPLRPLHARSDAGLPTASAFATSYSPQPMQSQLSVQSGLQSSFPFELPWQTQPQQSQSAPPLETSEGSDVKRRRVESSPLGSRERSAFTATAAAVSAVGISTHATFQFDAVAHTAHAQQQRQKETARCCYHQDVGVTVAAGSHRVHPYPQNSQSSSSHAGAAAAAGTPSSGSGSAPAVSNPPVASPAVLHSVPPSYLRTSAEQSATASLSRLLPALYGLAGEEHGHRTVGHSCVSREEMAAAAENHHDLLYGEVLPVGATKLFDQDHLALADARSLCDLGSGLGKLALQAFLQFPNLRRVFGCELSASRFRKSRGAVQQLKKLQQHCRAKLMAQGSGGQLLAAGCSDAEDEEESKCERPESLQDALALPHLSLQLEHDAESGAVSMVRYEESLPHASSRLHPLWGDLSLLESSCADAGVGAGVMSSDSDVDASDSTGSDCEGSSSMESASSPALSSSGASSASPPALHLRSSDRGLTRSLEFRCLNLFHLEEAMTADVVICETKFTEDKSVAATATRIRHFCCRIVPDSCSLFILCSFCCAHRPATAITSCVCFSVV